jgi:hypothetical protein
VATPLLTADTSVTVPALLTFHDQHEQCFAAAFDVTCLTGHALTETYRVLTATRGPTGGIMAPTAAVEVLMRNFPDPPSTIGSGYEYQALLQVLANARRVSGAVYDGVIAQAARADNLRLLTRDRRAIPTYEAVGVDYEIVE